MIDNSIVFLGFGLRFDFSLVVFEIFGFEVRWYGIIIVIGFLCGFFVSIFFVKKEDVNLEVLFDIVIIVIFVVIIFVRVYYVIFNFKEFKDNILSIFVIC